MIKESIKKHRINPRANGIPYVEKAMEDYKKLTSEERTKVDEFADELEKILGPDEDED